MKKILFLFIFTAILTHAHNAYAGFHSEITDGGGFTIQCEGDEVGILVSTLPGEFYYIIDSFNSSYGGVGTPPTAYDCNGTYYLETADLQGETSFNFVFVDSANNPVESTRFNFSSFPVSSNIPTPPAPSQSIWRGNNGFWGSTTPSEVADSLEASVQATGANIWPMYTYVGIGIAFFIALMVLQFIIFSIQEKRQTQKKERKKEDFIYHSAEDLEFKRNYGQEFEKKKRGRPKKII